MEDRVSFIGARGLRIQGLLDLPSQKFLADKAVIILPGFTGYKEETHIAALAQSLAVKGIASLRIDASGWGESDGHPSSDYRVSHYLEDAEKAVIYLRQAFNSPDLPLGVAGHSLGASLAIILAAKDSSIKVCSAIQPCTKMTRPSTMRDLCLWEESGAMEITSSCPTRGSFLLPWEFCEDADRFDASLHVTEIKCPLQIIYGSADTVVVPSDTLEIANKVALASIECFEGVTHDYRSSVDALNRITKSATEFICNALSKWN